jgi:hypothetical protein
MLDEGSTRRARILGATGAVLASAILVGAVLWLNPPNEATAVPFAAIWLPGVPVLWLGVPFVGLLGWLLGPRAVAGPWGGAARAVATILVVGTLVAWSLAALDGMGTGQALSALVGTLTVPFSTIATLVLWLGPFLMVAALSWAIAIRMVFVRRLGATAAEALLPEKAPPSRGSIIALLATIVVGVALIVGGYVGFVVALGLLAAVGAIWWRRSVGREAPSGAGEPPRDPRTIHSSRLLDFEREDLLDIIAQRTHEQSGH